MKGYILAVTVPFFFDWKSN